MISFIVIMPGLSCLYGDNAEFVEKMYSRYLQGDKSFGEDWYRIFSSNLEASQAKPCSVQHAAKPANSPSDLENFFRSYGHFFASLNPLSTNISKEIDYQKYIGIFLVLNAAI